MPKPVQKKPAGPAKWIKLGATIAALIGLLIAIGVMLGRASQTREYNRIISESINEQKYDEAIPRLEKLLETAQPSVREEARKQLARCYVQVGENPGLSLKKSAENLKKAYDIDPSALDEAQKQAMKAGLAAPPPDDGKP